GHPIAQARYSDKAGAWSLLLKPKTGGWREVQRLAAPTERPNLRGLGRDGQSVLVEVDMSNGSGWKELAPDSGTWTDLPSDLGGQEPIHDPDTGALIGQYSLVGNEDRYAFFDPKDAKAWAAVVKAYPGDRVQLSS